MLQNGDALNTTPLNAAGGASGKLLSAQLTGSGSGACAVMVTRTFAAGLVAVGLGACVLTGPALTFAAALTGTGSGACALTVNTARQFAATLTASGVGSCDLTAPFPRGAFTAAILAEKNRNDGVSPTAVLKMDFATGTLFVGAHAQTITGWDGADRTVQGWVFSFGRFDDVVRLDLSATPALAGDVTMRFWCPGGEDGTNSLWSRLIDSRNQPEKTVVRFYRWWRTHLDAATDPPVCRWEGTIKDWRWVNEDTMEIIFGDPTERLDKLVGTAITRDLWPNVDPDDLGTTEPIVYGDVPYVPARAVDAGPNSTLAFDMTSTQTVAYYSDIATTFAMNGSIFVGQEECAYVGKTTEVIGGVTFGKITNLTRGANGTTAVAHKKGSGLLQKQAAYLYLAAGHAVDDIVEAYLEDVTGELLLIDPSSYGKNTNNNGKATLAFTTPPKVVRSGDVTGVNDTIGVGGGGDVVSSTEIPASWDTAEQIINFPASRTIATFPGTGGILKQLVRLQFSRFDVTYSVPSTVLINGVVVWSSALNPSTPSVVEISHLTSGNTVTISCTGDASTFVIYRANLACSRVIVTAGAATKSGTVTLIGNSAADVFIGGRIFCRVRGYKDDAAGTFTGTPNALIQNTRDTFKHFCVTHMGYAPSEVTTSYNLAAKMGSMYQCNGAILEQARARVIRARMAFESGCWVKDAAGLVTLIFRERFFQPAHVLSTPRLVFLDGDRKTVDRDRLKTYETINRADVRYARDYTQAEGEGAYLSFVRKEDLVSQGRYNIQENPALLRCNWVRTDAHAAALAQLLVDLYGPRRTKMKVRTLLHHMDVAFGDRVRLQDRMQKYLPGEVLSVDHQPEHAINGQMPFYDFTILGIEEAEAMLQVQDKIADYTLTAQDQHQVFRNTGASGPVVLTLPPALVTNNQVMRFGPFVVDAAQALRIRPDQSATDAMVLTSTSGSATDKIAPTIQTAKKYLGSSTARARLIVECTKAGEWLCYQLGAWTIEA